MKIKYSRIAAAFLALGAVAASVGAGTVANLLGSDSLYDLTRAVFVACFGNADGGVIGPYADTGSLNGQAAMEQGKQTVAPMSTFLDNRVCPYSPAQSEGLVIGLSGIAVVGWTQTFASDAGAPSTACNGPSNIDCHDADPGGAARSTTIQLLDGSSYTFTGWRDVLRVLLAGFDHGAAASGTGATAWAARDCNSFVRQAIANNYGNFFENHCSSPGGSNAIGAAADSVGGRCTMIRHVFRPDDFSGVSQTMVSLLGLPSIVLPSAARGTGATPFCNAVRPAFVFPGPAPTCLVGADATYDPTVCVAVGPAPCTAANVAANTCTDPVSGHPKEKGVYRATMQNNDPIRRPCAIGEQVCTHCKSNGLVLPMNQPLILGTATSSQYYPTTAPSPGTFMVAPVPEIFDAIDQHRILPAQGALCPNGDVGPSCLIPASAGPPPSPNVLAKVLNAPALVVNPTSVSLTCPSPPGLAEGREYNQHLYQFSSGFAATYITNGFKIPQSGQGLAPNGIPVTGAYYRIHTTTSLNANGHTCQLPKMTDQIGCLVEASPCSMGFAGRNATNPATNPNTAAVKINGQSPEQLCITGDGASSTAFRYPLSHKIYLNSIPGFAAVSGEELQLAGCATDLPQGLNPTAGGIMTTQVPAAGFFNIPPWINSGEPFCEDFNENMLCGAATNTNACALPHANFSTWPAYSTTCGNGIVEAFEDCDCGTIPGVNQSFCGGTVNGGSQCSLNCRRR